LVKQLTGKILNFQVRTQNSLKLMMASFLDIKTNYDECF
jgi:hypothetical protein